MVYGKSIKISIFGQSHSEAIGVVIEGLPAGLTVDTDKLAGFLQKRAPGRNEYSTPRREWDIPEFVSGFSPDGVTCGAPLCALIRNTDTRSGDYNALRDVPRPGHADFPAYMKYGNAHDIRGGGHFSGRLTAPLCIAGGICMQVLAREGIYTLAHIAEISGIADEAFDPVYVGAEEYYALEKAEFPVLSEKRGAEMREAVKAAKGVGDSVGGVIECAVSGVPAGLGDPLFGGLDCRIAAIVFGIPAVRGLEFGTGFDAARLRGSENNDPFYIDDGVVKTRKNNHGGLLGGITTGMPIIFRAAVKPTPSIAIEQDSVSLSRMEDIKLTVEGRHDPCIVPRAVPCVEAAAAIAVCDALLDKESKNGY